MHIADVLTDLAQQSLDDVDEMAAKFVERVLLTPPYNDGVVSPERIRDDSAAAWELILRQIANLPVPVRLKDLPETVGRTRAQAGIPIDVLLSVMRVDFTILWDTLLRHADESQLPEMVQNASRVWEALEQFTVRVQFSYLDESALMVRERDQELGALVAAMLAGEGREPLLSQAATALGMRLDANFVVAAAAPRSDTALRDAAERLKNGGVAVHVQEVSHRAVLIAQLARDRNQVPPHWLRGVACGLGPVANGFADVARVVSTCAQIAETIRRDDTEPITLVDRWPEIVSKRLADLTPTLCAAVLPSPTTISESERMRLLETLRAYLRTGSVAATAAELYCHRNTVLNRFRRLTDLTGHDVMNPSHAAAMTVALTSEDEAQDPMDA